jgi:hypothetical protein
MGPLSVRAVPLAAVIPSPGPGRGRGGMGRIRVRGGGQAGSIKLAPAPRRRGRQASDLAPGRWPGRAVHAAGTGGWVTGGWPEDRARQRIWPSRRP